MHGGEFFHHKFGNTDKNKIQFIIIYVLNRRQAV